ncbi:MAG TPA: M20/M25/M40 family metallo-hydrolase [Pseudonocardia sp.]|jgi:Zn-dependent M28 family amino/carboxypeptidase|nr:M20/M25/M40 family metallo-hydrolase [Pseudonocardia sp.]
MMRVLSRTAAALLVLVAVLLGAAGSSAVSSPESVDTTALRAAMSIESIRDHLVALNSIARDNGGTRAVGTPGFQASVEYVRERLTADGYQVRVQSYEVPYFKEIAPPSLSSGGRAFVPETDIRTMSFSGSGDVNAAVQPVDLSLPPDLNSTSTSGCEPSDFASFSRGAIALLQRGTCPFEQKATNARNAGAVAVLIMNEGQPDRRNLLSGSLVHPGVGIPVLGLTYAAGATLARQPDLPARVATTVTSELRKTSNVIADGIGGGSDRVVMVGAHLDSVPDGPGINDDGSGVAVVLQLADALARQPIVPRNRIRFAFWGAEELGMLGSQHYVSGLTSEQIADISVYLNFDMLASPNYVRFVLDGDGSSIGDPGPPGSAAVERTFTEYLTSQGLPFEAGELSGRSDYAPFAAAGVPVGGLFSGADEIKTQDQSLRYGGTAGKPLDGCYHQACDTLDNISDDVLSQFGAAAADATLRLLMGSPDPRQTR